MEPCLWPHSHKSTRKVILCTVQGTGTVQNRMATNDTTSTPEEPTVLPASGWLCNKQVKGKIPAKTINMCIKPIKPVKSPDHFLKHVKDNDQKKKEAKEKGT